MTVSTILGAFLTAARSGERKTSAKELSHFERLTALVADAMAGRDVQTFDADCLSVVRDGFLSAGWSRRHANRQTVRFRTVWRWAERKRLIPSGSWSNLQTLQLGTGEMLEQVQPVPEVDLARTLLRLARIPRAMVDLQLLTGARPGEIVKLKPRHFRMSGKLQVERGVTIQLGKVWAADLGSDHKTGWRGRRKLILCGPRAQAVLRPFLERDREEFLFDPREAVREWLAEVKTRDGRRVGNPRRRERNPGDHYTVRSYESAIERACARADVDRWSPGQLRHNAASRLAVEFGPEVARIILGHRELSMTRNYIQDDLERAVRAIETAG